MSLLSNRTQQVTACGKCPLGLTPRNIFPSVWTCQVLIIATNTTLNNEHLNHYRKCCKAKNLQNKVRWWACTTNDGSSCGTITYPTSQTTWGRWNAKSKKTNSYLPNSTLTPCNDPNGATFNVFFQTRQKLHLPSPNVTSQVDTLNLNNITIIYSTVYDQDPWKSCVGLLVLKAHFIYIYRVIANENVFFYFCHTTRYNYNIAKNLHNPPITALFCLFAWGNKS